MNHTTTEIETRRLEAMRTAAVYLDSLGQLEAAEVAAYLRNEMNLAPTPATEADEPQTAEEWRVALDCEPLDSPNRAVMEQKLAEATATEAGAERARQKTPGKCPSCNGSGLFDKLFNVDCSDCKGTGQVECDHRTVYWKHDSRDGGGRYHCQGCDVPFSLVPNPNPNDSQQPATEPQEWSGSCDPCDPANFWIDDETGERVSAETGERTAGHVCTPAAEHSPLSEIDRLKLEMWPLLVHAVIKASIKLPMAKHNAEVNAELNRLQKQAMEVDPETVTHLRKNTFL